jgi:DNA-binding Xre family transcriptional regulator
MVSGISTTFIVKLGRGENVQTDVVLKICKTLDCEINDIINMVSDE